MSSVTKYPSTGADDSSIGSLAWASPGNIIASDNTYATATASQGTGVYTHYLKATNFGFAIPSGATINGIVVTIERKANYSIDDRNVVDNVVRLVKGGVVSGNNKADTSTYYPTVDGLAQYGGATDLWGLTFTPADINSSNFGVVLSCYLNNIAGGVIASVDAISITVYYTEAVYKDGSASISGAGTLSSQAVRIKTATATVTGVGTVNSQGLRIKTALANLLAQGILEAIGGKLLIKDGAALLSAISRLTAQGVNITQERLIEILAYRKDLLWTG